MKVAVIGLGNISNRHRKNVRLLLPHAKIFALSASGRTPDSPINDCDEIVFSIEELLSKKLDLVIVASPASLHVEHARPFIQIGIPTLIEKPLCTNLADAHTLQQAQAQHGTAIAVGYCLRFLPSMRVIKKVLDSKRLGTLYQIKIEVGQYLPDWRPTDYRLTVSAQKNLGGGALFELSHELDYAHYLFGTLKLHSAVLSSSKELALEVEDSADILATTQEQAVVYMHLDFLQKKTNRTCVITGSKGRLEWDLIQNSVILIEKERVETLYSKPDWDKDQMYLNMLSNFLFKKTELGDIATLNDAEQVIRFIEQTKKKAEMI